MDMVEGALEPVVYEMAVVMAGYVEQEASLTKSLMVWTLEIQIDYFPRNNGKICQVGKVDI